MDRIYANYSFTSVMISQSHLERLTLYIREELLHSFFKIQLD